MSADMYQTMSLRTLSSEPSPSLRASLRFPERHTNRTDDIPGAKPFRVEQRWQAKPNTHSPADIERARPQALHPPKNQPTFVNRVDDIEGARPQKVHFSTGRSLDPLDPKYPLPSVKVDQPPPPRLLRPTPTNDDIRGSKPKSYKHIKSRPSMRVDDIEGAKAWSARARETRFRAQVDPLDVSDINSTGFKSQRVTDPLRPEHAIHGRVVRDDEGTFPRQTKTLQKPDPRYSTHDIEGAVPGWRPIWNLGGLTEAKRRPERVNPVDVADVPGAQANTAKRTVRTSRHLDPNAPDYVALDGKRLAAYTRPPTAERRAERLRRQEEELRRQWRAADARRGGATPTPTAGGPVDPSTLKDALAEAATSQRIEELEA